MKKALLYLAFILLSFSASAQNKLTWLGVDFTHVKLVGEFTQFMGAGEKNNSEIQSTYFPGWNMLFVSERDKYNIAVALGKDDVYFELDTVMKKNATADAATFQSYNNPTPFTKDQIKSFLQGYPITGKEGIGAMFIAEVLNKGTKEGIFHLVVINMKTGEVLLTERFTGEPSGFGIRNYWGGAICDIVKQIAKKHYKV